jgi:hypothetical protein
LAIRKLAEYASLLRPSLHSHSIILNHGSALI